LPDACNSDLGHLIAGANQTRAHGLSDDALLLGIELDGHGAQ
jgi:hypothetical protein